MGRIRLQICVLPWEQPGPLLSNSGQTRQETVKWCEPCTEDTHMQEVCDRIFMSWARMFEPSMGPLNIRYLKTTYGEFVDLQERVVGDLFDDRGADGKIPNSSLEVHRYPPSPDQLQTLQRFSSLAPTSSARPRKRPLELPPQSDFSQTSRDTRRAIPSIEEEHAETERPFGTAVKRRRTDDPGLNKRIAAEQSLEMSKDYGGWSHHSSQSSGTQESVHQVPDSQRSPRKRHPNPYGTPTSLAIISSQESLPANEIDLSAIPDSPLGREAIFVNRASEGAIHLDRGSPKEESPELRASVREVPPTDPVSASGKQPTTSATSPKPSTPPFIFNSASQPPSIPQFIPQIVDGYIKKHGLGVGQIEQNTGNPNRISPIVDPARAPTARSSCKSSHDSDPIFDPIESDTESFNEKQQMQNAKRLRSSKKATASIISPCASNEAEAECGDSQLLVPSVPQRSMNGACIPSGAANAQGQRESIQKSSDNLKAASMNAQDDVQHQKLDAKFLENQQSESCNTEQNKASRETPSRDHGCDDLTSTAKALSQATTNWSQDSAEPIDGTGKIDNQKSDEHMSRQEPEPDKTTSLDHDANDVIRSPPKKARVQEEELAEAKRTKETKLNAARLADEKKTSERLAREQQIRDAALAEEAKKIMLEGDGAKSIQAEKMEKEKAKRRGTTETNIGRKRSMTPLVPETTATKSSSHQTSSGSSPSSNPTSRNTGSMNAPLRSALRQTPRASGRSVSSVSFDVPPRAKLNDVPSMSAINAPSKTPNQNLLPKTASKGKITKTLAKNGKVQTTLNMTVHRKKLKGRVFNLPMKSTPAPKQKIVLSSGEDSSTSEEPKWQSGNAKAGPSSRKPMFPVTNSQGEKTAEVKRPSNHIDPNIRNTKVEKDRTADPATVSRLSSKSGTTSLQKSNSRSPAQALLEAIPLSSGSASSSDSGSASGDSNSGSDSEKELHAPSSKTPTGGIDGRVAIATMKKISKTVDLGPKQSQGSIQSKGPSQPSRASSSGSRNTVSVQCDGKHVDQVADKKVQLESRHSVSRSRVQQAPSTTSSVPDYEVVNQGLNHAGRLPNGIRPAYYKYPTLTELQKLPRSVTPPTLENSSSQALGKSPLEDSGSDDSSSESDDSSSTSDEDESVRGVAGSTSSKKSIFNYRGYRGLVKLAKKIPSFPVR